MYVRYHIIAQSFLSRQPNIPIFLFVIFYLNFVVVVDVWNRLLSKKHILVFKKVYPQRLKKASVEIVRKGSR